MSKPRRIPQRMCVACRQMKDKRDLARVVRSPEGWIFVDDTGKGAGRGAYICTEPDCLTRARRTRALERALDSKIDDDVYDDIAAAIAKLRKRAAEAEHE